jgi:hypothetical protein
MVTNAGDRVDLLQKGIKYEEEELQRQQMTVNLMAEQEKSRRFMT